MLVLAVVFSLAAGQSPNVGAGVTSPASSLVHEMAPESSETRSKAPDEDVVRNYELLQAMPVKDRTQSVGQLPSQMKAAVWAHHLLSTLSQHPEFTSEQRAVIQDALAIMSPELFDIDQSSPNWADLVDKPLRQLAQRAKAVFPPKQARELFVQLGPEVRPERIHGRIPSTSLSPTTVRAPSAGKGITPLDVVYVPTCSCS